MDTNKILAVPPGAGKAILQSGGVFVCKLLNSDKFVAFCKDRAIEIDRARLLRLERLGLFCPIFCVCPPSDIDESFDIPIADNGDWFDKGWAIDTTERNQNSCISRQEDDNIEKYYSIFQIYDLEALISMFTMNISLDSFLDGDVEDHSNWNSLEMNSLQYARTASQALKINNQRAAVALLCQFISDRYGPQAMTNGRTILIPYGPQIYIDHCVNFQSLDWDWRRIQREWNLHDVEIKFNLTPEKLQNAYESMSCHISNCDPLDSWYQLVQFVSIDERAKLKDKALRAETLRLGAYMIRLLYKDLYGTELPPPHEVPGQIINYIPELSIRNDTLKYLEFVVNRYQLNPKPKLTLFLEGESEQAAVLRIFEEYYGNHPGKFGVELIVLGGVDVATGTKEDKFRAILRLVDYLHHHQTITFLILDNENYAKKLKSEVKSARSILHKNRNITRDEYVKIWNSSFEFDNFSATEIAAALTSIAQDSGKFFRKDIITCKADKNSGSALKKLYKERTTHGLDKIRLAEKLVDMMLDNSSKRKILNRPLVQVLNRVLKLASRNPFPGMERIYQKNQLSKVLGKKC